MTIAYPLTIKKIKLYINFPGETQYKTIKKTIRMHNEF
jgi:hypothetical protein